MVALVDDFERRGVLQQDDDGWRMATAVDSIGDELPDDLRRLVLGQIARLGDDDRRLIEAAAVAGADFSAALVAAALQVETVEVEDRCSRLAADGRFLRRRAPIQWPDGSIASGFGFLHALYWQAADEQVPAARRAQWQRNVAFLRGDLAAATATAGELLREAEQSSNAVVAFEAHTMLGQCHTNMGHLADARRHFELALQSAARLDEMTRSRGAPRVMAYLAWVLWFTGRPEQALQRAMTALESSSRAGAHTAAIVLGYTSWLHVLRGEPADALILSKRLALLTAEHGLVYWRLWADFMLANDRAHRGHHAEGAAAMRRAIEDMRATGGAIGIPNRLCALAEAELAASRPAAARQVLAEACVLTESSVNALFASELARLTGEVELAEDEGATGRKLAEERFVAALNIARRQGARAYELRAAVSLGRLLAEQNQKERAIGLLEPIVSSFDEGDCTADLQRATALLAVLNDAKGSLRSPIDRTA